MVPPRWTSVQVTGSPSLHWCRLLKQKRDLSRHQLLAFVTVIRTLNWRRPKVCPVRSYLQSRGPRTSTAGSHWQPSIHSCCASQNLWNFLRKSFFASHVICACCGKKRKTCHRQRSVTIAATFWGYAQRWLLPGVEEKATVAFHIVRKTSPVDHSRVQHQRITYFECHCIIFRCLFYGSGRKFDKAENKFHQTSSHKNKSGSLTRGINHHEQLLLLLPLQRVTFCLSRDEVPPHTKLVSLAHLVVIFPL